MKFGVNVVYVYYPPNQRKKFERLCRYITRPAIAEQRLSLASNGNVVVALKTPFDDGTSHVVLGPMEFMGHLAALAPKPRVNLTRFHGVFSPHNPAGSKAIRDRAAFGWAQRLKRVLTGRPSALK